jgi:hypothetical protein
VSLDANEVDHSHRCGGHLDVNVMGVGGHVRYGRMNERVREVL